MSDFIAPGGDLFVIPANGGEPRNVTPGIKASITGIAWTGREEILKRRLLMAKVSRAGSSRRRNERVTLAKC